MCGGTIDHEVEAPAVVRGDVWSVRVSEPLFRHDLTLGTHGLAGDAYPGPLHNLGAQTHPGAVVRLLRVVRVVRAVLVILVVLVVLIVLVVLVVIVIVVPLLEVEIVSPS